MSQVPLILFGRGHGGQTVASGHNGDINRAAFGYEIREAAAFAKS
jgi:hypothetical protein